MTTTTHARALTTGAVEYFRAKLDYETTPFALKTILDEEPGRLLVIDVRDEESYADGHIPGARNIPLGALVSALSELSKEQALVTYCSDIACALSLRAALELSQKGFRVQHLLGGLTEWCRKGYPVESGAGSRSGSQAW